MSNPHFRISIEAFDGIRYQTLERCLDDGKLVNMTELARRFDIDAKTVKARLTRKTPAFNAYKNALNHDNLKQYRVQK